jgi:hypothetical protein
MVDGLVVVRLFLLGDQFLRFIGSLVRLVGCFLCQVGSLTCLVGGPLHLFGAFARQPLLIFVGPVLRQLGGLLREFSTFLGPDRCLLCLLG